MFPRPIIDLTILNGWALVINMEEKLPVQRKHVQRGKAGFDEYQYRYFDFIYMNLILNRILKAWGPYYDGRKKKKVSTRVIEYFESIFATFLYNFNVE